MKVGSKVICVDGSFDPSALRVLKSIPVNGGEYTIKQITEQFNTIGILLEEVTNPLRLTTGGMKEPLFRASRFAEISPNIAIKIEENELVEA